MASGLSDSSSSWVTVPKGNKLPEPRIIALHSSWALAPKWMMTAVGILLGTLLEYGAISSFLAGAFDRRAAVNAFAGMLCYLASGADRMFYLADEGIVSETRCWGYKIRKMARWDAIRDVWLVPGNKCFTAAFEVGFRMLKLPFPNDSAGEVEDLLKELLPDGARIKRPTR